MALQSPRAELASARVAAAGWPGRLVGWYQSAARDLPWRRGHVPYRVWVSEIMLQQTRVEAVRDAFTRFVRQFPGIRTLARAPLDDVLAAWSGLGYYRRARLMHAAAKQIVARHGGKFPRDTAAIGALPGVGPYTAGAIRSIAFNEPAPIVDGNIERVFARWFAVGQPIKSAPVQRQVWAFAQDWVQHGADQGLAPRELNQALMELGAMLCTPRAPRCGQCPAQSWCKAAGRDPLKFPRTAGAARARSKTLVFTAHRDNAGRVWLVRRQGGSPPSLLPDGLWELPHTEGPAQAGGIKHAIMNWRLSLVLRQTKHRPPRWPHGDSGWFTPKQAALQAQASATRKLLRTLAPEPSVARMPRAHL